MVCLLLVLFFAVTGLTLNHPSWTFAGSGSRQTVQGTLPSDFKAGDTVDWLRVAEFLRSTHGLRGQVSDYDDNSGEGSISFRGPGYGADGFFQLDSGSYDLTVTSQGTLALFNDLHKGRDAGSPWRWVIDGSAALLVVIALSGLTMQFFLRKRRLKALSGALIGTVVFVVVAWRVAR